MSFEKGRWREKKVKVEVEVEVKKGGGKSGWGETEMGRWGDKEWSNAEGRRQ
jgi:hypothetical protein